MSSEIEWFGMNCTIPDGWEIVQHSTDAEKGSLGFVDRRYQRAQLNWRRVTGKPETNRMMQDLKSRDRSHFPDAEVSATFRLQQWTGYYRTTDRECITRAGTYDKKWQRWIDLVIIWPQGYNRDEEYTLLSGFKTRDYKNESVMRWRAFNMCFYVPKDWTLQGVLAGSIQKVFEFAHAHIMTRIIKRSIPQIWHDADLEHILRDENRSYNGTVTSCTYGTHEARCFRGREKQAHFRWLLGRRFYKDDVIWECPSAYAIYQISSVAREFVRDAAAQVTLQCHGAS